MSAGPKDVERYTALLKQSITNAQRALEPENRVPYPNEHGTDVCLIDPEDLARLIELAVFRQVTDEFIEKHYPPKKTMEECFHCGMHNRVGYKWCMRCGLWPTIDYTAPLGERKKLDHRTSKIVEV